MNVVTRQLRPKPSISPAHPRRAKTHLFCGLLAWVHGAMNKEHQVCARLRADVLRSVEEAEKNSAGREDRLP